MKEINHRDVRFLGSRHSDITRNVIAHAHDFYELNFLTSGKTKMRLNNKVIEYNSYDFLLIPPGMKHLLYESEYKRFDNYVIWFARDEVDGDRADEVVKLHDYEGAVQFLCAEIYRLYTTQGNEQADLINLYLQAVILHMKKGMVLNLDRRDERGEEMIESAVKYINQNILTTDITIGGLAKRFNVSPEHFSRVFKEKIGTTPVKYVGEVRVAEAKRLLAQTGLPIKDIAARLHYADQFYFSKHFNRLTGSTPREYRRAAKAQGAGEGEG